MLAGILFAIVLKFASALACSVDVLFDVTGNFVVDVWAEVMSIVPSGVDIGVLADVKVKPFVVATTILEFPVSTSSE